MVQLGILKKKGVHTMKANSITFDSYDTINHIWEVAFNQIGDHDKIIIILSSEGYSIINAETNETVLKGEVI